MSLHLYSYYNSRVCQLETRFLNAVNNQDIADVKWCISKDVNPNCITIEDGNTVLHIAAETNNVKLLTELLAIPGIKLNTKNRHGSPPLLLAINTGCYEIVKLLVKKRANVNSTDCFGNTALHIAARYRSTKLAEFLLKHEANPNICNVMMNSPLHVAVLETPYLPMVKILLNYGANINVQIGNMSLFLQAILYCQNENQLAILKYLISKNINVNSVDKITKRNALHFVALTDSYVVAIELLKLGVDVNHKDILRKTPTDIAREQQNFDMEFIFQNSETVLRFIKYSGYYRMFP